MPQTINYSVAVQTIGGPEATAAQSLTVDAYDKIDITVPAAAGGNPGVANVQVQPSPAGKVKLLLVTSMPYSAQLSYKVDGRTTPFVLDAPHVLTGDGAVAMLGATQNAFQFSNAASTAAAVSIIVGRNAV